MTSCEPVISNNCPTDPLPKRRTTIAHNSITRVPETVYASLMPMSDLLRVLAGDCPELNSTNISDRCDVRCPTLAELPAQQGQ
jgi:hypothetical protein